MKATTINRRKSYKTNKVEKYTFYDYLCETFHLSGKLIALGLCSVALMVSILFFTTSVQGSSTPTYKYYTSLKVETGDTIWDLADEHISKEYDSIQEYIKEVEVINNIDADNITEGQILVFPYYSSELK